MPPTPQYKVIHGEDDAIERQLNQLAAEGWEPITMAPLGQVLYVILKKSA